MTLSRKMSLSQILASFMDPLMVVLLSSYVVRDDRRGPCQPELAMLLDSAIKISCASA